MNQTLQNVQDKEVGGIVYEVRCLPPIQALELKARLMKLLLPTLGALVPSGNMADLFKQDMNLEKALAVFSMQLDEKQFADTVTAFLKRVFRNGQPISFDVEFTGRTGHMLLVFWAALEVNYGDFFAVVKERMAALPHLTNSTQSSAGQSGE